MKKEIFPFATTWKNLEGMLSEVNQTNTYDLTCGI